MCNKKGWRPMKPLTGRSVALLSLLEAVAAVGFFWGRYFVYPEEITAPNTLIGVIYNIFFLLDFLLRLLILLVNLHAKIFYPCFYSFFVKQKRSTVRNGFLVVT